MNIYKNNQNLLIGFTIQELIELTLWPMEKFLLNASLEERQKGKRISDKDLNKSALEISKKSAKSKDYEYWTAIFTLYGEFDKDSEICFYLKDTFKQHKDSINTYEDLEKYKKEDTPADVVIRQAPSQYFEFQLKKYQGELNLESMISFIKKKIMRYSSPANFCIILQHTPGTQLPDQIFEDVHKKIKEMLLERDLGRICFLFNANNQDMVFAYVYPELFLYKKPFINGANQIRSILS